MNHTSNVMLYVRDMAASRRFYSALLGREPVEDAGHFVLFVLTSGLRLGLWSRDVVEPTPVVEGGASEIGFRLQDTALVDETHASWVRKGARIALPPTDLHFGRSFVALDPDGHRLRVYAMSETLGA
ncbi:drug:proton antiporter [Azorhizobium oxalatiphilum]|uniref:Drug:proton antiporter n=1 Tax=Azorhizobium oxalatiphilum TaxID=980631 RepID=A0A917FEH0_9HYPH|nr:VOC family protein [Azorhizobium oxalatiphilum]GGF75823.1 drug:proton antiporter [Azorhizobium oxalatiphilum]